MRGRIRVTEDVDVVVKCTVDQALEFVQSADPTRFTPLIPEYESVARSAFLIPLIHQTTGVQLDLAVGVSGFEQQIVSRATPLQIGTRQLRVATAEDVLLMKLLAGRPQDDQDVRGIVEIQGTNLDWGYCLTVAGQLDQALGIDIEARVRSLKKL